MPIRIVAVVLASVAYILGTHWLMTRPGGSPWNAVGVVTPMLAAIAIGAWRGGQRVLGAAAALAIIALCTQALRGIAVAPPLLYLAQHAGIHLSLAIGFGSTLRAGRTPLITTMAARVHHTFTPARRAYTRHLTLAWTLYFVAMAAISLALFAYLLTPCALVLMFGGEYLLRYRLHPEFERTSITDAIRSYMHDDKAASAHDARS